MDYSFLDSYLTITTEDIFNMIEEIEKEQTAIIRKTPKAISDILDSASRENESIEFSRLHSLYITPLLDLAKLFCNQLNLSYSEIPSFSNLSIMGRFSKLCDFLISKGCTVDTIKQLFDSLPPEIEEFLEEKKNSKTPLIRKKPETLILIPDIKKREEEIKEFNCLHNLYVLPLSEFAVRICTKLGISTIEIPNIYNLSIMGRMSKLRDFLISKGCTIETITKLLPQSTSEIDLLIKANKYGFDLGYANILDITNENRLARARQFLQIKNNQSINTNIEVKNNGRNF